MTGPVRHLIATCAVFAAMLAAAGCGSGGSGAAGGSQGIVVASVGTANIGKNLLDHWTAIEQSVAGGTSSTPATATQRALALLISWQWTLGEAGEAGVRVTDGEAAKQLSLSKADLQGGVKYEWFAGESRLEPYLASSSVTGADPLWLVRLGMLAARLAQRRTAQARTAISHARILAYYRHHRSLFVIGERRDIKAIMNTSRPRVLEAKREMQSGTSFARVAERFNQTIEGGLRLGRARGDQTKRYEKDYFAAPPHVLIGPLKEIYYYIFEVFSIKRAYQKTLAQAEPEIVKRLAAEEAEGPLVQAYARKWRARTHCRAGYIVAGCGAGGPAQ